MKQEARKNLLFNRNPIVYGPGQITKLDVIQSFIRDMFYENCVCLDRKLEIITSILERKYVKK